MHFVKTPRRCTLVCFFLFCGLSAVAAAQNADSAPNIVVEKEIVRIPCPGKSSVGVGGQCDDSTVVGVTVTGIPSTKAVHIEFKPDAGRVVGEAPNFRWNLTGVAPGRYEIRADISPVGGIKRTVGPASLLLAECPDCYGPDCSCPLVSVSGPKGEVERGEDIEITSDVAAGGGEIRHSWKVEGGTIVSGEGTSSVVIRPFTNSRSVTATLHVDWNSPCSEICPMDASTTVKIRSAVPAKSQIRTTGRVKRKSA